MVIVKYVLFYNQNNSKARPNIHMKNSNKMISKPNLKKMVNIENDDDDDDFWITFENILYRVFTFVSWGFFQFLMVIAYAAFEAASIKIYHSIVIGINALILLF
mmetsp:Transcript_43753/g.56115  ORF Transcript_43753/g.56115 Transcript_43753/m.56115 type:complete len:104 (-) Transcript_43753:27-338(-)